MEYTPKHLERWALPRNYFGEHWDEYYVAPIGHHRDSDLLTEVNWEVQNTRLLPLTTELDSGGDSVRVVVEDHWACEWVEWLAIHESNPAALKAADNIAKAYEDYPILDEMLYSKREWDIANDVWDNDFNMKDRIHYCTEAGIPSVAARKSLSQIYDDYPNDCPYILDRLRSQL